MGVGEGGGTASFTSEQAHAIVAWHVRWFLLDRSKDCPIRSSLNRNEPELVIPQGQLNLSLSAH